MYVYLIIIIILYVFFWKCYNILVCNVLTILYSSVFFLVIIGVYVLFS